MDLQKAEFFRYSNETLTTCTAILNTIDSRSNIERKNPLFFHKRFIAEKKLTLIIFYGCVYKRLSKPVMKGSRVETIENARKEYKQLSDK